MSEKQINPGLKMALEYGPIILFFVGYTLFKDRSFAVGGAEYSGFIAVTAMFIPLLAATTFVQWRLTGHLSKMQIVTLVLVVGFGGLSIWLNDERFFKMKPTMIYLLFAGALGFGLLRGQSYLEAVMDQALPMEREGWMILTRRVTLFFLGLAIANEAIWRTMSTDAWVNFKTFGLTLGTFAFFATQMSLFSRYGIESDDADTGTSG
ncbi:inner membrane-spanning protein YciB [Aliiroseovarius sp.]|uniref:inner membrane-spanning protein YciB n=1 Tax=Aliiroseovarius sp. TaxID=1872442 RepID=UPI00262052E4|nr:inner membrane-spanning protein YciB [Aliiroseovarius sp.]